MKYYLISIKNDNLVKDYRPATTTTKKIFYLSNICYMLQQLYLQ